MCLVFYVLLVPFWLLNYFRRDSLLNETTREGICWPIVQCCGCIWHVWVSSRDLFLVLLTSTMLGLCLWGERWDIFLKTVELTTILTIRLHFEPDIKQMFCETATVVLNCITSSRLDSWTSKLLFYCLLRILMISWYISVISSGTYLFVI